MRARFGIAIVMGGLVACGELPPHRATITPASDTPGGGPSAPGPTLIASPGAAPEVASAPDWVGHPSELPAGPDAVPPSRAASLLAKAPSVGAAAEEASEGRSQTPRSTAGSPTPASAVAGAFDGAVHLTHFFSVLAALEAGHARDDVRILHFGDSHTASDSIPSVYRRQLQARFGDGGRGFVPLGIPWKNYVQDGVRAGMSKDFVAERARPRERRASGDDEYGLLGVAIGSDRPGARAWTQVTVPESRIEIDYLAQPNGGGADVYVDGAFVGHMQTRAAQREARFFSREVSDAPHEVDVRAVGDGGVRLFGMALDRSAAGVVVDALGINGAQIYTPLRWSAPGFAEQLRHRAPDLVILAYGTNEALDPKLDIADYEQSLVELLGRFARAVPSASCLLLGPPDLARRTGTAPVHSSEGAPRPASEPGRGGWYTWPPLADVIAVQRRVAHAAGCAFFDQREAMGGAGTMVKWAAETDPRAQADRVHFTRSGYTQLGSSFSTELLRAYDAWRAGNAPSTVASR